MRVVFLTLLALLTFYVFIQRRRLPFNLIVMIVLVIAAVAFIVRPEMSDVVAHYLGVGTSADLITYLILIGLVFAVVHYYVKFSIMQAAMTKVVRKLALLETRLARERERDAAAQNGMKVDQDNTSL